MEFINTKPGGDYFHLFESVRKELYDKDSIIHKQQDHVPIQFLKNCFVLQINGKPVARATLYSNPLLSYQGYKTCTFGNYECVESKEISSKLLAYLKEQAKLLGAKYLLGPMNGSTWENHRFSLHHDYPNFLLEPYHHLYYNQQLTDSGFTIVEKYRSNLDTQILPDNSYVLETAAHFKKEGVRIRLINLARFDEELENLFPFVSTSFRSNYLYSPIGRQYFLKKYKEALPIINPEYVRIAEDQHGQAIGFIFCYDDLFNTKEKSLVIKTISRDASPQWKGLGHVLANEVISLVKKKGYKSLVHAFMRVDGSSTGISRDFTGKEYKNYGLYGLLL